MNNENNFKLNNDELEDMDKVLEIKDEELKQISGGSITRVSSGGLVLEICVLL